VIGLGAMGSAGLYKLSKRPGRTLGIDQFEVPHEMGSSHGLTRIIRLAYHEHPSYVPLLRRAYTLWHELEEETREQLLFETGSVDAGPPGSGTFEGSLKSCKLHNLPHEVFDSVELHRRFPGYQLPRATMAVWQPQGGYLRPEACIRAYLRAAMAHGAEVHTSERVLAWKPERGGVRVVTSNAEYTADRLVCSAGPWMSKLVSRLVDIAVPERQVVAWFRPHRPEYFTPGNFPVFNVAVSEGAYYGFPVTDVPGFKVGRYHHRHEVVDPDTMDRECREEDEFLLRDFVQRYFPDAGGPILRIQCCVFTNTPDEHFLLDIHPDYPQVVIASPCSGHGFKFASVIGEILNDLAERGETAHDISMHRIKRFSEGKASVTPSRTNSIL